MIVITSDGVSFDVPSEVVKLSDFLRGADADEEMVIPKVSKKHFETIMRFCELHSEDPMKQIRPPLSSDCSLQSIVGESYYNFVRSIDVKDELVQLIHATDFLGIEPMMHLLCARMAILASTIEDPDEFLSMFD